MRFDPPDEARVSALECVAIAARTLFNADPRQTQKWSELSTKADEKNIDALALQGQFMKKTRKIVGAYERFAAGIAHKNPLSQAESQRTAEAGLSISKDGVDDQALLKASKRVSMPVDQLRPVIEAYGDALTRRIEQDIADGLRPS